MKVAIFGATGVLGRNVIPRLQERGHAVLAVVQDEGRAARLRRIGVACAIGSIVDGESARAAVRGCEAVLHLATRIPLGAQGDWSENDRIRRQGTRNALDAAVANGAARYVQQSIVMLYGDYGERLVDESTPLQPGSYIQSALDMEEMVRSSPLQWTMLRGGYFYGPGTGMEDRWREAAREGALTLPGDGGGWLSLIHVVDMARAVVTAMESAPAGSVYNVVDDGPATFADIYGYVAAQLGAAAPSPGGPPRPSLKCSNARLKRELGWAAAYPTYRAGLAAG